MEPNGHARFTLKKNPKEEMGRTREQLEITTKATKEPDKEEEEEEVLPITL